MFGRVIINSPSRVPDRQKSDRKCVVAREEERTGVQRRKEISKDRKLHKKYFKKGNLTRKKASLEISQEGNFTSNLTGNLTKKGNLTRKEIS